MNLSVLAHVEWWHWPLAVATLGLIVGSYLFELRLLRDVEENPAAELP